MDIFNFLFIIGMVLVSKLFIIPFLFYSAVVSSVSIIGALRNRDSSILISAICFIAMHYSWGWFLSEIVKKGQV